MNVLVLNLNSNEQIDVTNLLQEKKINIITDLAGRTKQKLINVKDLLLEKEIKNLDGAIIVGNEEISDEYLYYIILLIMHDINIINIIPKNTLPNSVIKKISTKRIKYKSVCPIIYYNPYNIEEKMSFWLKSLKKFHRSHNDIVYTLRLNDHLYKRIKDVAKKENTTVSKLLRQKLYVDFI